MDRDDVASLVRHADRCVAGAGAMAYNKAKEASALNTLAWNKVQNFLAQNGVDVNELLAQRDQDMAAQQGQAQPGMGQGMNQPMAQAPQSDMGAQKFANDMRAMVDSQTDEMAIQMLQELGIDLSAQSEAPVA